MISTSDSTLYAYYNKQQRVKHDKYCVVSAVSRRLYTVAQGGTTCISTPPVISEISRGAFAAFVRYELPRYAETSLQGLVLVKAHQRSAAAYQRLLPQPPQRDQQHLTPPPRRHGPRDRPSPQSYGHVGWHHKQSA